MRQTTRDEQLHLEEWRAFLAARSDAVLPCANGSYEWTSEDKRQQQKAAALCRSCAVQTACARWAVAAGEKSGVWGGLTPAERKRLRRAGQAA